MQLRRRGVLALALLVLVMGMPKPVQAASDLVYQPYGTWNGKKVYLSPARHNDSGRRGECRKKSENVMAYNTAWHASNGTYYGDRYDPSSVWRNLRSRGYQVRIGRGSVSTAISNSNAWGADVHIPIHSNADFYDRCGRKDASRFGTVVIYKSYGTTGGQGLSQALVERVGPASPGTRDFICHNSSACTKFDCLAELCKTKAKAAYLEAEFHTWNRGIDEFLDHGYRWAWRLGWSVDHFLNYPRR